MYLSEVHAGGADNAIILGQYLAKIIINKITITSPTQLGRHFTPIWWTPSASRPTSHAYTSISSVPGTVPVRLIAAPWNAMMQTANEIMRYAEESDDGETQHVDVNTMGKYANQYISQQIFNILNAQAVTTDYEEN
jgi:hypothetical protein